MASVLIWSPNYRPELTGIPPLVTDAAEWLSRRGHHVEVVTALPNYPARRIGPEYRGVVYRAEHLDGVSVHRTWLRVRSEETLLDKALYELSFASFSFPHALRLTRRADVIVCVVPSLLAGTLQGLVHKRLVKRTVLWLQDLVLLAARSLDDASARGRWLLNRVAAVEARAFRAADQIISCSPGFVPYLVQRGVAPDHVVTVPNWVDTRRFMPVDESDSTDFRVVYAGNFGYTQGFETVMAASGLVDPGVRFELVGAGNAAGHVHALAHGVGNVHVRDLVPDALFPQLLSTASVLLVLQRRISAGANLPSKIASYLAAGRPVVASIDEGTPAADLLRRSGGAIIVPPEDGVALARTLSHLRRQPELCRQLGENGRGFAERELDRAHLLPLLEAAILDGTHFTSS
jgi:colanic acid biosynthesis glycosyl transferase WcaI